MTDTATAPAPTIPAVRLGDHIHVLDAATGVEAPAHVIDHGPVSDHLVTFTRLGSYIPEVAPYDRTCAVHGYYGGRDPSGVRVTKLTWHLSEDCGR